VLPCDGRELGFRHGHTIYPQGYPAQCCRQGVAGSARLGHTISGYSCPGTDCAETTAAMIHTDNPGADLPGTSGSGFRHEAVLYEGDDEFLDGTLQFVRDGFEAGEATLMAVSLPKMRALRAELAFDGEPLYFADIEAIGKNPACIIPAWARFVEDHGARGPLRGIGEPIWPGRSADELDECHRHEVLLNTAFADTAADPSPDLWLRCPYDTAALDPEVVERARHTHPFVLHDGERELGTLDHTDVLAAFSTSFSEPRSVVHTLQFDSGVATTEVRNVVANAAQRAGVDNATTRDLVVAVHELATNSLRHGGGAGQLRVWRDHGMLTCEVSDLGHILDPLAGRRRPEIDATGGRGLWIANRLADLVQVRTSPAGTAVRVHVRTP